MALHPRLRAFQIVDEARVLGSLLRIVLKPAADTTDESSPTRARSPANGVGRPRIAETVTVWPSTLRAADAAERDHELR